MSGFRWDSRTTAHPNTWNLGRKIYIGGLRKEDIVDEVAAMFFPFGIVTNAWVARNPPGFGFVEMENRQDAVLACRTLDGRIHHGKQLKVEMSTGDSRWEKRNLPKPEPAGYRREKYSRRRYHSGSPSRMSRSPSPRRSRRRRSMSRCSTCSGSRSISRSPSPYSRGQRGARTPRSYVKVKKRSQRGSRSCSGSHRSLSNSSMNSIPVSDDNESQARCRGDSPVMCRCSCHARKKRTVGTQTRVQKPNALMNTTDYVLYPSGRNSILDQSEKKEDDGTERKTEDSFEANVAEENGEMSHDKQGKREDGKDLENDTDDMEDVIKPEQLDDGEDKIKEVDENANLEKSNREGGAFADKNEVQVDVVEPACEPLSKEEVQWHRHWIHIEEDETKEDPSKENIDKPHEKTKGETKTLGLDAKVKQGDIKGTTENGKVEKGNDSQENGEESEEEYEVIEEEYEDEIEEEAQQSEEENERNFDNDSLPNKDTKGKTEDRSKNIANTKNDNHEVEKTTEETHKGGSSDKTHCSSDKRRDSGDKNQHMQDIQTKTNQPKTQVDMFERDSSRESTQHEPGTESFIPTPLDVRNIEFEDASGLKEKENEEEEEEDNLVVIDSYTDDEKTQDGVKEKSSEPALDLPGAVAEEGADEQDSGTEYEVIEEEVEEEYEEEYEEVYEEVEEEMEDDGGLVQKEANIQPDEPENLVANAKESDAERITVEESISTDKSPTANNEAIEDKPAEDSINNDKTAASNNEVIEDKPVEESTKKDKTAAAYNEVIEDETNNLSEQNETLVQTENEMDDANSVSEQETPQKASGNKSRGGRSRKNVVPETLTDGSEIEDQVQLTPVRGKKRRKTKKVIESESNDDQESSVERPVKTKAKRSSRCKKPRYVEQDEEDLEDEDDEIVAVEDKTKKARGKKRKPQQGFESDCSSVVDSEFSFKGTDTLEEPKKKKRTRKSRKTT